MMFHTEVNAQLTRDRATPASMQSQLECLHRTLVDAGRRGTIDADELAQAMRECGAQARASGVKPEHLLIDIRNCLERARLPYGLGQAYRSRAIGWALEEFFRNGARPADS